AAFNGVFSGIDDTAGIGVTHTLTEGHRQIGSIFPVGFSDGQISDTSIFEYLDCVDVGVVRICFDETDIDSVLVGGLKQWCETHTHSISTDHIDYGIDNLAQETKSVL